MKIQVKTIRQLLNGELTLHEAKILDLVGEGFERKLSRLLREEGEMPQTKANEPTMLENDSLDTQVDRFLMQAEDQKGADAADGQAPTSEGRLYEDDPMGGAPAGPPPPADAADNGGQEQMPPEQAIDQKQQNGGMELDAMAYSERVARVIEHASDLLDIKGTIVRRALNYVTKNYDEKQASEVKQILEGNFGLSTDSSSEAYEDVDAPRAANAGPGLNQ